MLAILWILQAMKLEEDGEMAPPHYWKWFVATAAAWPLLLALLVIASIAVPTDIRRRP
jgi:hypothetical protein